MRAWSNRVLLPLAFCVVAIVPLPSQQPGTVLHDLLRTEWDYEMQQNPVWASLLGDRRWNDRWDDLSLEAIAARHQHHLKLLEQLRIIDRSRLSRDDQLEYDVILDLCATWVEEDEYHWYLVPENHMSGLPEGFRMPTGVQA